MLRRQTHSWGSKRRQRLSTEIPTITAHYELPQKRSRSFRVAMQRYALVVVDGPHRGQRVAIDQEIIYIGRNQDLCDLVLELDQRVSQTHAKVVVESEANGQAVLTVQDMGSRNGLYVGGFRVRDAYLEPGQQLRLGNSVIAIQKEDQTADPLEIRFMDESGVLVGQSAEMRRIFALIRRLRNSEVPVLLTGETGTGKTSVARALHMQSSRSNGPFVSVNCGALSPSLIESLLFGHEKGAFTGADQRHAGFFEQAHGGILFLDEIGELPLEMQPKLLDVIESRQIQRLGSRKKIDVDFRLIAATHRELPREVELGRFREDLYYRLSVVTLEVPPLRRRSEDIPLLVEHILEELYPGLVLQLSSSALQKLQDYLWPGNVRQLHNVLARAFALSDTAFADADDIVLPALPEGTRPITKPPGSEHLPSVSTETETISIPFVLGDANFPLKDVLTRVEQSLLESALEQTEWNVQKAAFMLEIAQSWLYKRMKKYNLKREEEAE